MGFLPRHSAILIAVMTICLMGACVADHDVPGPSLGPGDECPAFSVTLDDGRIVSTPSLRGRTAVITFFNTTCPDCRAELPLLQKLYMRYANRTDIIFLCIARGQTDPEIRNFWLEHSLTIPYSAQPGREVYDMFATSGIPRTYIVAPDLIINRMLLAPDIAEWVSKLSIIL